MPKLSSDPDIAIFSIGPDLRRVELSTGEYLLFSRYQKGMRSNSSGSHFRRMFTAAEISLRYDADPLPPPADLTDMNLTSLDFDLHDLSGLDLTVAHTTHSRFAGAKLTGTRLPQKGTPA